MDSGGSGTTGLLQNVRASFERAVSENKNFFPDFYDELLSKKEEYARMFGDVDMVHQYARLYNGMAKLFEYFENPQPESLHLIAEIHSAKRLDVRPTHYLDWLDALLATIQKSDSQFSPELAEMWVSVLMPGIEFMKSRYAA